MGRQTSFLFYLQAALAGVELGYFNAGYLCHELKVINGRERFTRMIRSRGRSTMGLHWTVSSSY